MMTTIKLFGGDLGSEAMYVRCDLTQASAPVQVDYDNGDGFVATQYQCADVRHQSRRLADLGKTLAAGACEMAIWDFACDAEEVEPSPC